MKKIQFLALFLAANTLFIFLHIHKHVKFVQHSFAKQRYERQLNELAMQKDTLINKLYAIQDRADIKSFAQNNLKMKPVALNQVKKLGALS